MRMQRHAVWAGWMLAAAFVVAVGATEWVGIDGERAAVKTASNVH